MTTSVWRYSHLTLAISSFLVILIASVTGIILAFEPISNQLKNIPKATTMTVSLATTISSLQEKQQSISSISVDDYKHVQVSVLTRDKENKTFYIDPITGIEVTNHMPRHPLFKWATTLHRSLFLKTTGRILVGFFALLLFLIVLAVKRQGGYRKFFSKVIYVNFNQYYHIIFGRLFFLPLIIITLTGLFLSLGKHGIIPITMTQKQNIGDALNDQKHILPDEFLIFKNTPLATIKRLDFPFSEDPSDSFELQLQGKTLIIHQYSGIIREVYSASLGHLLNTWALVLHTGRGTLIWAIVLQCSCLIILFLMSSGFTTTWHRFKNKTSLKNNASKRTAEYIILVGSELGTTFKFAKALQQALLTANQSVYVTKFNSFETFDSAHHLILLTATYGAGDAPSNATNFLTLLKTTTQKRPLRFSVVGFGSKAYRNYCQYAINVDQALKQHPQYHSVLPLYKINNQSFHDFKQWSHKWSRVTPIDFNVTQEHASSPKEHQFEIIEKTTLNCDSIFMMYLRPNHKISFKSGDLLAITPPEDGVTRLYSIAKINHHIVLSIKRHECGVCSNFLHQLNEQQYLKAYIQKNKEFHFPKSENNIILIANGTGIAPFLGMLNSNSNHQKTHLFWGGRTPLSFEIYAKHLEKINFSKSSNNIHLAFSRLKKNPQYIQDILADEEALLVNTIKTKGHFMICGSRSMLDTILKQLDILSEQNFGHPLCRKRIQTDCY